MELYGVPVVTVCRALSAPLRQLSLAASWCRLCCLILCWRWMKDGWSVSTFSPVQKWPKRVDFQSSYMHLQWSSCHLLSSCTRLKSFQILSVAQYQTSFYTITEHRRDEPVHAVCVCVIYSPIDMVLFTFTLILHFHHLSKSKIVFGQNPSRVIK